MISSTMTTDIGILVLLLSTLVSLSSADFGSRIHHFQSTSAGQLKADSLEDFREQMKEDAERQRELAKIRNFLSAKRLISVEDESDPTGNTTQIEHLMIEEYLAHPIDTYLFFKQSFQMTQDYVNMGYDHKDLIELYKELGAPFPYQEDVQETLKSLVTLQSLYQLITLSMASGNIREVRASLNITADDYLMMGLYSINGTSLATAAEWFEMALHYHDNQATFHITEAILRLGNIWMALNRRDDGLNYYRDTLRLDDENRWSRQRVESFENMMKESHKISKRRRAKYRNYSDLCRHTLMGKMSSPRSDLICRYRTLSVPIIRYKEEVYSWSPYVTLFYDVIDARDTHIMRRVVNAKMEKAVHVSLDDYFWSPRWSSDWTLLHPFKGTYRSKGLCADADLEGSGWPACTPRNIARAVSRTQKLLGQLTDFPIPRWEREPEYKHLKAYRHLTGKPNIEKAIDKGFKGQVCSTHQIGKYHMQLQDALLGGGLIFPEIRVNIMPPENSVVFWRSCEKFGDSSLVETNCPVLIGKQIYAQKISRKCVNPRSLRWREKRN